MVRGVWCVGCVLKVRVYVWVVYALYGFGSGVVVCGNRRGESRFSCIVLI